MNPKNLFREAVRLLQDGQSFAVATVFDNVGSVPRTAGAKMLVRLDGSICGSIGGGRLEAENIREAGKLLALKQTAIRKFDLTSEDAAGAEMVCGGKGEVLIDSVDAADKDNRLVYEAASEILERNEKAWLVTILDRGGSSSGLHRQLCLVRSDKTVVGRVDCDPYILEKLIAGPARISIHADVLENQRFLVEPLRSAGTVYIFGAGHVSQRIAPLSTSVGFRTVVLDDRVEYANRSRFAEPVGVMVIDSFCRLPELAIDENSYLVIVTRGHLFDKVVLEQVLRSGAAYIGMIGSRSKRDKLYEALVKQGYGREELARVCSPIGTSIGAETPEELAVSIVGELIRARSEREGSGTRRKAASGACCRIESIAARV